MAILFRDLAMPEIVFSEQNKKLTENRTEMKGAELMSGKRTDYLTWDEYFMGAHIFRPVADKAEDRIALIFHEPVL